MFKAALHLVVAMTLAVPPGAMLGCGCAADLAASESTAAPRAERKCRCQGACVGCCGRSAEATAPGEQSCCSRGAEKASPSNGVNRVVVMKASCDCFLGSTTPVLLVDGTKSSTEGSAPRAAAGLDCAFSSDPPAVASRFSGRLDRRKSRSAALVRCVELRRLLI
jgi:hypothetical protein